MRASGLSVSVGVNSSDSPSSTAASTSPIFTRSSVLKRSRATNTCTEVKRANGSRRRNTRVRWRSCRRRMPIAWPVSVAASIWNSSSRGYASRIACSDLAAWLSGTTPAASSTWAARRRTCGMSSTIAEYAVEVYRPRKRASPITWPAASWRFTAM